MTRLDRRNQLVEQYRHLLRPIAASLHRNLPPAFTLDDLEQLGVLGLIDAAARFDSYARQKIRGAMLDGVRREYAQATTEPLTAEHLEIPDSQTPEKLVIEIERTERVREALNKLGTTEAEVIEFRFIQEQSQRSTAKQLGISQRGVGKREARAIKKLRKVAA